MKIMGWATLGLILKPLWGFQRGRSVNRGQRQYNIRPHPGPLPQGEGEPSARLQHVRILAGFRQVHGQGDRSMVAGNCLNAWHIPPQQIQEDGQAALRDVSRAQFALDFRVHFGARFPGGGNRDIH